MFNFQPTSAMPDFFPSNPPQLLRTWSSESYEEEMEAKKGKNEDSHETIMGFFGAQSRTPDGAQSRTPDRTPGAHNLCDMVPEPASHNLCDLDMHPSLPDMSTLFEFKTEKKVGAQMPTAHGPPPLCDLKNFFVMDEVSDRGSVDPSHGVEDHNPLLQLTSAGSILAPEVLLRLKTSYARRKTMNELAYNRKRAREDSGADSEVSRKLAKLDKTREKVKSLIANNPSESDKIKASFYLAQRLVEGSLML